MSETLTTSEIEARIEALTDDVAGHELNQRLAAAEAARAEIDELRKLAETAPQGVTVVAELERRRAEMAEAERASALQVEVVNLENEIDRLQTLVASLETERARLKFALERRDAERRAQTETAQEPTP